MTIRRTRQRERGAVYVETLVCLVPVLTLFFCAAQLALLGAGRLVVYHAAARGARAAIVLLEDDPARHGGAPRGDLTAPGTGQSEGLRSQLRASAPDMPVASGSSAEGTQRAGVRLQAIREAVYMPLAALAPSPSVLWQGGRGSLHEALGGRALGGPLQRLLFGFLAYGRAASAITVHAGSGGRTPVTHVPPRADVTVRVTYLQHCAVPIAAHLVCRSARDLPREVHDELEYVESPQALRLLLLGGDRFSVVRAEATLPNQGARYYGPR